MNKVAQNSSQVQKPTPLSAEAAYHAAKARTAGGLCRVHVHANHLAWLLRREGSPALPAPVAAELERLETALSLYAALDGRERALLEQLLGPAGPVAATALEPSYFDVGESRR